MKKFEGTPTPWGVREGFSGTFVESAKETIEKAYGQEILADDYWDDDWKKHDANLVAAAPDLLAFALDFIDKVESGRARSTDSYNKAKIAVKKALGEND